TYIYLAGKSICDTRFINTGKICKCAERVNVQESIKDDFIAKFTEAMKEVTYGNPLESDNINMGPLINKESQDSVKEKVDKAVSEGAKVASGGTIVKGDGYFFEPTVIVDADH